MAPLLTDGVAGDAPDPGDVELLDADHALPATGPPFRLRTLGLVAAALAVGVAAGVRADSWVRDRESLAALDREAHVDVADVTLRLSSFQLSALDVAIRNEGPRDLVLQRLTAEAGAVRPRPGVLPVTLPAGQVVLVRLRFGDLCGRLQGRAEDAGRLDAVVRTRSGDVRTLALDVVGDDTEVQYVADTVRAACH